MKKLSRQSGNLFLFLYTKYFIFVYFNYLLFAMFFPFCFLSDIINITLWLISYHKLKNTLLLFIKKKEVNSEVQRMASVYL